MKAVILAGGRGTRLAEETELRPKPMIEIGGRPILWHIMKIYGHHGITDFVICLGYKGYLIKEYFANYVLHSSDVTVDLATNEIRYHNMAAEPWTVTLVDTGDDTQTGILEESVDAAGQTATGGIRLDDRKSSLDRHVSPRLSREVVIWVEFAGAL